MDTGIEARCDPRVGAAFPVDLQTDRGDTLPARSRDVSVSGVCVETPSPFSYRSLRRVVLHLPTGPRTIEATGRWQREEPADRAFLTGISFDDPPPETVTAVWDLVFEYGKSLAQFLFGKTDLSDFTVEEAIGLAHASRFREVSAGRYIYRPDVSRSGECSVYLVCSGSVVLELRTRGAIDRPIERLGVGRLFGGMEVITDARSPESAIAASDVQLLEIDRRSYRFLSAAKPWLAQRLAQAVTRAYLLRTRELLLKLGDEL